MSLLLSNSSTELTKVEVIQGEDIERNDGTEDFFSGLKITIGGNIYYVGRDFELNKTNGSIKITWIDPATQNNRAIFVYINRTIFSTIEDLVSFMDSARNPINPSGPGSSVDLNYIHHQTTALSTWTVVHNLGKKPSVAVVDSGENQWFGDVQYIDDNSLSIIFSTAFTGKAYLN